MRGGARPPLSLKLPSRTKLQCVLPAEWADTLTLFHLYTNICILCGNKSDRLSLQSSELAHAPSPASEFCPPHPFGSGGDTLVCGREGGKEPIVCLHRGEFTTVYQLSCCGMVSPVQFTSCIVCTEVSLLSFTSRAVRSIASLPQCTSRPVGTEVSLLLFTSLVVYGKVSLI